MDVAIPRPRSASHGGRSLVSSGCCTQSAGAALNSATMRTSPAAPRWVGHEPMRPPLILLRIERITGENPSADGRPRVANPWRCMLGLLRRLRPPGGSRRCGSLEQTFAGGLMRQRLAGISLRNSPFHLRKEVETLHGVLDGGVGR